MRGRGTGVGPGPRSGFEARIWRLPARPYRDVFPNNEAGRTIRRSRMGASANLAPCATCSTALPGSRQASNPQDRGGKPANVRRIAPGRHSGWTGRNTACELRSPGHVTIRSQGLRLAPVGRGRPPAVHPSQRGLSRVATLLPGNSGRSSRPGRKSCCTGPGNMLRPKSCRAAAA